MSDNDNATHWEEAKLAFFKMKVVIFCFSLSVLLQCSTYCQMVEGEHPHEKHLRVYWPEVARNSIPRFWIQTSEGLTDPHFAGTYESWTRMNPATPTETGVFEFLQIGVWPFACFPVRISNWDCSSTTSLHLLQNTQPCNGLSSILLPHGPKTLERFSDSGLSYSAISSDAGKFSPMQF